MRASRVGLLRSAIAIGATLACVAPASTPAIANGASAAGDPAFKLSIYPAYATRGFATTFEVMVKNTSRATTLHSLRLVPPTAFKLAVPTATTRGRARPIVQNRTFVFRQITLKPGAAMPLTVTATPTLRARCGRRLGWVTYGYAGGTASGTQLALPTTSSRLKVTVLCPQSAACGDGGPPCSTNRGTNVSSYAVVDNATSGSLHETVDVGKPLTCRGYRNRDPNWYDSILTNLQPSAVGAAPFLDTVTYKIIGAKSTGIGFCLGAPYDFTTASQQPAPAGTLPNGKPGFIGLLPLCSAGAPPCIQSISQSPDPTASPPYDANLTVTIPEKGDPWGGS